MSIQHFTEGASFATIGAGTYKVVAIGPGGNGGKGGTSNGSNRDSGMVVGANGGGGGAGGYVCQAGHIAKLCANQNGICVF